VGRRESHDASAFYRRFEPPEQTDDVQVSASRQIPEPFVLGDARHMDAVRDNEVALVVTSPPYFAGKQYELELGRDGTPESYLKYLEMLRDVFAECKRILEPGGRLAVNVANLGRRPYRSLSADVIRILQDDLHLLMLGEVIWRKGAGASGSCAWGTYCKPGNPVLRDTTERVLIAGKGRFGRALDPRRRRELDLPHCPSITADEFMASTLDVWDIPPESAQRVGHPAPFPLELPARLIELYTWEGDLVADPFMGSGSTLVAAVQAGRRYVGYDTESQYVELARRRVRAAMDSPTRSTRYLPGTSVSAAAKQELINAGFRQVKPDAHPAGTACTLDWSARDAKGQTWFFEQVGDFSSARPSVAKIWEALGKAYTLARHRAGPLALLAPQPLRPGSPASKAVRAAGPRVVRDVIGLTDPAELVRLATQARGDSPILVGYWSAEDILADLQLAAGGE